MRGSAGTSVTQNTKMTVANAVANTPSPINAIIAFFPSSASRNSENQHLFRYERFMFQ